MSEAELPSERVKKYLQNISPQARKNLLAEIERLQMYGETMPGGDVLLEQLRAEFRGSGETHDRLGNPSRHFFQPIEALFVNRPAERTNPGQISRGSLSPIWEWIANDLLRTMTRDYNDKVKDALIKGDAPKARTIARDFQSKVLKSLEGSLDSDEGIRRARSALAQYTASEAAVADLRKVMAALRVRDALEKLDQALPLKIDELHGKVLANIGGFLDAFAAEQGSAALPFALALVARHLKRRWQLVRLATSTAQGRGAAAVAASRFAISIVIVLDHLDDVRLGLKQALKRENRELDLVPDAFFEVEGPKGILSFFLEADQGTMTRDRFLQKMKTYWKWYQTEFVKPTLGMERFRVLTIAPTEERKENLRRISKKADYRETGSNMFQFLSEEVYSTKRPDSILGPIWMSPKDDIKRAIVGD